MKKESKEEKVGGMLVFEIGESGKPSLTWWPLNTYLKEVMQIYGERVFQAKGRVSAKALSGSMPGGLVPGKVNSVYLKHTELS